MSSSRTASASLYLAFTVPLWTSLSGMPPSSLYWIQKSASSLSSAAGNRSSAASPGVRPLLALAVRVLIKNSAPTVPAPTARDFPKNERRLMELLEGFALPSELFFAAVDLLRVFMHMNREAPLACNH